MDSDLCGWNQPADVGGVCAMNGDRDPCQWIFAATGSVPSPDETGVSDCRRLDWKMFARDYTGIDRTLRAPGDLETLAAQLTLADGVKGWTTGQAERHMFTFDPLAHYSIADG